MLSIKIRYVCLYSVLYACVCCVCVLVCVHMHNFMYQSFVYICISIFWVKFGGILKLIPGVDIDNLSGYISTFVIFNQPTEHRHNKLLNHIIFNEVLG